MTAIGKLFDRHPVRCIAFVIFFVAWGISTYVHLNADTAPSFWGLAVLYTVFSWLSIQLGLDLLTTLLKIITDPDED